MPAPQQTPGQTPQRTAEVITAVRGLSTVLNTAAVYQITHPVFQRAVEQLVHADALKRAILDSVPPSTKDNNINAFNTGREYGHTVIKGLEQPEHVTD